jgi:nitrogen fixation NifU-like protein
MTKSMSLYREHILDHYKRPRNFGTMENADVSFTIDNPLCGDRLTLQIKFSPPARGGEPPLNPPLGKGGRRGGGREYELVADAKFTGQGCAISVASASMLTEYLKDKTRAELLAVSENDVYDLLGIPVSAARIQCALLPLNALKNILSS